MTKEKKEWLEERFNQDGANDGRNDNNNDDDDHDSLFSIDSNDTLHNFIEFQSHRNNVGLEEAISFAFPFEESSSTLHSPPPSQQDTSGIQVVEKDDTSTWEGENRIRISTLLEEDDLVPIFDGAGWAGTRVWSAAIWGIKYLVEEYGKKSSNNSSNIMSLCELGCGLGVPGMIWHQMGGDVVLSDQESIMSQLKQNVESNFKRTYVCHEEQCSTGKEIQIKTGMPSSSSPSIQVKSLDWSREGYQHLLGATSFQEGFDIVLNCDCVYEPLYGKSWEMLVEVIDECLKNNPNCIVVTSVERRTADGIDDFVDAMKSCEFVGSVEKILEDQSRKLELYITKGIQ